MVYSAISQSIGKVEIESLPYIFDTGTDIIEAPVVGDDFFDPNTGKVSQLVGQTRYDTMTLTGLLSRTQFRALKTLKESPKSKDGTLTATSVAGESNNAITTILTGVRLGRLAYGAFDKLSNSPMRVTLEISYSGTRLV